MFLTIPSVNSTYNFSEFYLLTALILLQINNYFSKSDLENIRNKSSLIGYKVNNMRQRVSMAYRKASQTSKMELFVKKVKGWNPLTIFEKSFIVDFWLCSESASDFDSKQSLDWRGTDFPSAHEKSTKNQSVAEWYRCGKCGAMDKNVECLHFHEVEAVEYFVSLDMKYDDMIAVTQRV